MKENETPAEQAENIKNTPKKESKFKKFVLRHKFNLSLILLALIILGWALIKIALLENEFKKEKQQITTNYELKIDSLNSERLLLTAKTFSWAIRSELLRENNEQINQYFNDFIKNPDIIKLQLINPTTSVVDLSTDKKDEGTIAPNLNLTESQIIRDDASGFYIITPISGLNSKIGIFVMQVKKTKIE
jgi:hypothetical protein